MKYRNALLIVLLIILVDQVVKVYIKTHFCLGEEVKMAGEWAKLHFLENEGMAFGMKISQSHWGKLVLSLFRLVAVVFGFAMLRQLCRKGYANGLIVCGAMILAGALGNLIDSTFYGLIFTESPTTYHFTTACEPAKLVAFGQGYGRLFHGRVVDMLYFPIARIPLPGGRSFEFFEPVFNIADAAISVGVIVLIIFQKKLLRKRDDVLVDEPSAPAPDAHSTVAREPDAE